MERNLETVFSSLGFELNTSLLTVLQAILRFAHYDVKPMSDYNNYNHYKCKMLPYYLLSTITTSSACLPKVTRLVI